ncbi:MAG: hypothetical protein ACTSX9_00675 [Candidatus Njordarchaeales archaeon]
MQNADLDNVKNVLIASSLTILSVLLLLVGVNIIYNFQFSPNILRNTFALSILRLGLGVLLISLVVLALGLITGALENYQLALKIGTIFITLVGIGNFLTWLSENLSSISSPSLQLLPIASCIAIVAAGIYGLKHSGTVSESKLKPTIAVLSLIFVAMLIEASYRYLQSAPPINDFVSIIYYFSTKLFETSITNILYIPFGGFLAFFSLIFGLLGFIVAQRKSGLSHSIVAKVFLAFSSILVITGALLSTVINVPELISKVLVDIIGVVNYDSNLMKIFLSIILATDFLLLIVSISWTFLIHYKVTPLVREAPTLEETIEETAISEEISEEKEEEISLENLEDFELKI